MTCKADDRHAIDMLIGAPLTQSKKIHETPGKDLVGRASPLTSSEKIPWRLTAIASFDSMISLLAERMWAASLILGCVPVRLGSGVESNARELTNQLPIILVLR